MKPVELVERAILNSSKSGEIVLDGFGGSGSTLIAAEKTGRKARLMELDPKFCDVIVKRWKEYTGNKAQLYENKARLTNCFQTFGRWLRTSAINIAACRKFWRQKKTPLHPHQMAFWRRANLLQRLRRKPKLLPVSQVPIHKNNLKNGRGVSGLGGFT